MTPDEAVAALTPKDQALAMDAQEFASLFEKLGLTQEEKAALVAEYANPEGLSDMQIDALKDYGMWPRPAAKSEETQP